MVFGVVCTNNRCNGLSGVDKVNCRIDAVIWDGGETLMFDIGSDD